MVLIISYGIPLRSGINKVRPVDHKGVAKELTRTSVCVSIQYDSFIKFYSSSQRYCNYCTPEVVSQEELFLGGGYHFLCDVPFVRSAQLCMFFGHPVPNLQH